MKKIIRTLPPTLLLSALTCVLVTTARAASDINLMIYHQLPKKDKTPPPTAENEKTASAWKNSTIDVKAYDKQKVNLFIVDSNPLLFGYKLGERSEVANASAGAILDFIKVFLPDIEKANAQNARNAVETRLKIEQTEIAHSSLIFALNAVALAAKEIEPLITASIAKTPPDQNFPPNALTPALIEVAKLVEINAKIEKAILDNKDVIRINGRSAVSYSTLLQSEQAADADPAKFTPLFEIRDKIASLHAVVSKFKEDYTAYRSTYGQPVVFDPIVADSDKEITQKIAITPRTEYQTKSTKEHQDLFSGTFSVRVLPKQSFHFRGGAGAIYSFVNNPEYSAAADAAGVVTISEKESDVNALDAAATLNIYPDKWWDEPFRPLMQIGYSPASNFQGILGGIGFEAVKQKVQLSAGIIYQQRRVLKSGQTVGMTIPTVDDLKVGKKWDTGFYVQVSIPLDLPK